MTKENLDQSRRDFVIDTFKFLKAAGDLCSLVSRSIPIVRNNVTTGFLVPITEVHRSDSRVISLLTEWRAGHQYAYPTRFEVTTEGTGRWLSSAVLDNPNRILFLICDLSSNPIGHLGLLLNDGLELEVDNVLRGVSSEKGLMHDSMLALEEFAYEELGVRSLVLKVLASNERAISFYHRLKYLERTRIPLGFREIDGVETLVPDLEPFADAFIFEVKDLESERADTDEVLTAGPSIGVRERSYAEEAVRTGWNSHHSDFLARFEAEFASYVGAKFAMATSSCTGALHLALLALGVGPGDEVLVPEVTWVATASAVNYVGATPIFVDIDPLSWTLDVADAERKTTNRTRAVMPVHLYGYPADMTGLMAFASSRGLRVVEDAAPAIGAHIHGRAVGSFGDFGCYSFQGAKMLVTGEGGMLVSSDEDLMARARKIQDHGRQPGTFWIDEVGYKYKMSNILAAVGLAQLERCELQIEQKRQICAWYEEALEDCPNLTFQQELPGSRSICWMTSVTLGRNVALDRESVRRHLKDAGIDSRPVFPPISTYNIWGKPQLPGVNAQRIGDRSINLPSGVRLSKKTVKRVSNELLRIVGES